MFIIDCTASMGPWIDACKNEINSIVDFIRSKNFGLIIRLSVVGYRDHNYGENQFTILPFTEKIDTFNTFISKLEAMGCEDNDYPEDVAGGLQHGLEQDWQAKTRYAVLIADAPCHGSIYHEYVFGDSYPDGDPQGRKVGH